MPQTSLDTELRQSLKRRLSEARALTDAMFEIVRPEAVHDRPIRERHRIIFYIGHLEAFDWNLLCRDSLGMRSFHPQYDRLFAFGIDPVDGDLPSDQPSDWPPIDSISGYNREVRNKVDSCLESANFDDPAIPNFQGGWALNIAIEHRLMHAETLGYMFHWLPYGKKAARPSDPWLETPPARRTMIWIPRGTVTLGLDRAAEPALGWDNEYEQHAVEVPAFAIDSHNVTNGDLLSFVRAGGYLERALWTDAAWNWLRAEDVQHPRFWIRRGDQWWWRGMFNEIPLPLDWPVYVSQAEAAAFARWCGKSLPTEAQLQRAAFGSLDGRERAFPWGNEPPSARHGNFDFRRWDPVPVGSFPDGDSAFGVADLAGNGWEWTCSPFAPFQGFAPLPFYPGYSANFFDGKHFVMKGGSTLTHRSLLRRSFRNWFHDNYPHIYAAFRCVRN